MEGTMNHKGTVLLETERLVLRPFSMDDLEQIYDNCWSKEEVWKWTSYDSMQCVEDVITNAGMFTERWLTAYEDKRRYSWAIQVKKTGEVMKKSGMHYEGTLRKAGHCNCGVIDQVFYSVLADDYKKGM